MRGATVCSAHGGRAPQVKAAAARRVALAEWATTYGDPAAEGDPAEVVLGMIRQSAGHVSWLLAKVQATDPDALVWGTTTRVERGSGEFPGVDLTKAAVANTWLVLYGQERDRLLAQCKAAHAMGIEERHVELAEQIGATMVDVLRAVLADLDLTEAQQQAATVAVPRHLRAITGGLG